MDNGFIIKASRLQNRTNRERKIVSNQNKKRRNAYTHKARNSWKREINY